MKRFTGLLFLAVMLGLTPQAPGQGFGGFDAMGSATGSSDRPAGTWNPMQEPTLLSPEKALNVITIDGTAELRVTPEGIRVVMAVISQAESADECQTKAAAQIENVTQAWRELGIADDDIVEDFINVLPVYEWRLVERDKQTFRSQQRTGYRMQSNLHVQVKTDRDALQAINSAFQHGVSDIVTFDYWSSRLDERKEAARASALKAAQGKAKTLLAVFDQPPRVINVQESTAVFLPHSLYRTYENVLEEKGVEHDDFWRGKPAIKAYRPKMTFFEGLRGRTDVSPNRVAMRPEISVVSTVRIYYQSPADKAVQVRGR